MDCFSNNIQQLGTNGHVEFIPELSERHQRELLEGSGISPEIVAERGYETLTKPEELRALGFGKAQQRVPALLVPTWGPDGEMVGHQIKPDEPRTNDKGKQVKYETPGGRGVRLNVSPRMVPRIADASARLWATEGAKKADALAAHGEAAISVQGVDCWQSKEQGGPLPEWDEIPLQGREVLVAYDSDVVLKEDVQRALEELTAYLHERGARVRIVYLPEGEDGKQGVDDFLAGGGTVEQMVTLAEEALVVVPDIQGKGLTASLADAITATDTFARDDGDALYRFTGGVYRPGGEDYIRERTKELLLRWDLSKKWTSYRSTEVSRYLLADAPVLWERPPEDKINVLNGLLQVDTGELEPHTADWLSPVQIPAWHDPEAEPKAWDRFIERTFPEDAQELAYELAGWLMVPDTSLKKAVLLLGGTDTGKSTFLQAITSFIGEENASAIPLQKLEESRFSTSGLAGMLANISDELPSRDLVSTAVFKKATGGNAIEAERKHGREFSFKPFARLVFSANRPPRSGDSTEAFFNRWIVVPFDKTFGPAEKRSRTGVDAELADPRELSGVLNRALGALQKVRGRGGMSQPQSVRERLEEFRSTTDPLAVWLGRHVIEHPAAMVSKDELRQRYSEECAKQNITPPNKTEFGRAIKREYPSIQDRQRTYNGKPQTHVYLGIGFKDHDVVTEENGDRRAEIEEALGGV